MNELKVYVSTTGRTYRFKPDREYIVGSNSDCSLLITSPGVAGHHLRVYYDSSDGWYVSDLGKKPGTFVENQGVRDCFTDYVIRSQTQIILANNTSLIFTPVGTEVLHPQSSRFPTPPPIHPPPENVTDGAMGSQFPAQPQIQKRVRTPETSTTFRRLSFQGYITEQTSKRKNWFARVATDFHLTTGLRHTPWIRSNPEGGNLDFGFDGYIVPDFLKKGSAEEVIGAIIGNLNCIREYQGTDCFITRLTDEHLIDSAKETMLQSFFSFRFFPVRRGLDKRYDYREMIVVSYNNIRTYLLVEEYGSDLFVNWITRYEPDFASWSVIWLISSIWITLIILGVTSGNIILSTAPIVTWLIIYLLLPQVMKTLSILPKRANAYLLIFVLLTTYLPIVFHAAVGDINTGFLLAIGNLLSQGIYIGGISVAIWAIEKYTAAGTRFQFNRGDV